MLSYIILVLSILCTIMYFAVRRHPNGIWGVRIDYTLDYPDIWEKVHTLTGILSAGLNVAALIASRITSGAIFSFIIWFCFLAPMILGLAYAAWLGRKRDKENLQEEEQQRRRAEQEESGIRY